jgi:hypothetical protein
MFFLFRVRVFVFVWALGRDDVVGVMQNAICRALPWSGSAKLLSRAY